jgi:hypothetical protein
MPVTQAHVALLVGGVATREIVRRVVDKDGIAGGNAAPKAGATAETNGKGSPLVSVHTYGVILAQ